MSALAQDALWDMMSSGVRGVTLREMWSLSCLTGGFLYLKLPCDDYKPTVFPNKMVDFQFWSYWTGQHL